MDQASERIPLLDGWRALSIALVLGAHLLPLGPKALELNETAALMGMALFFTLSGFLITGFLLRSPGIADFLLRRAFRIVPLAWLYVCVVGVCFGLQGWQWLAHFFFFGNLPPFWLSDVSAHFWSLCVEMQFYVLVSLLVLCCGRRGLYALPILCLLVTALRVVFGVHYSIVTWFRLDEILIGCALALALQHRLLLPRPPALGYLLCCAAFFASCHPAAGAMHYFRPYLAALLIYMSLSAQDSRLAKILSCRAFAYLAAVSYALYVLHPALAHSWLGSGEGWEKYAKRPLLFLALFALAHLSTFHLEQRFIAWGRRISTRIAAGRPGTASGKRQDLEVA